MSITSGRLGRVTTVWHGLPGTPYYSTHWFDIGDGSGATDFNSMVGDFWTSLAPAIVNVLTFTVLGAVEEVDVATGNVVGGASTSDVNGAGSATAEGLPAATQGILTLRTGVYTNGRQVRGRLFIPGAHEGESNLVPSTSYRTLLTDTAAELQAVDNANGAWVVYSRRNASADAITGYASPNMWGVLRSRRD